MKWEPILAMLVLFALGVWLVTSPSRHRGLAPLRENTRTLELRVGNARGVLEVAGRGATADYRLLWRDGLATEVFDNTELARRFGPDAAARLVAGADNAVFRIFAITSWAGLVWILVGFLGQALFFARMAVQWIVSERQKRSVVPTTFWILSLFGGVMLFVYFAWRRDIVGILGQTTGIVIYARNLRLISKEKARQRAAEPSTRT